MIVEVLNMLLFIRFRRSVLFDNYILTINDENALVKYLHIYQDCFEESMFLSVYQKNRLTDNLVPTVFKGNK